MADILEPSTVTVSDETSGHYTIKNDLQGSDASDAITKEEDNAHDVEEKSEESKSSSENDTTLTRRQKYAITIITIAAFLAGTASSIMGPLYSREAINKGMDIATVGYVFAVFDLTIFVTAPFFGTYLVKIGPRFVLLAGIFVGGCCNILFGTLQYCPNGTVFFVMSIILRAMEAVGFSGYTTSCFAIVGSEFKKNVALAFGVIETGTGLGFTLGPVIGGGLFELGGFGVPFYIIGVAVLLNGMAAYLFLPPQNEITAKRKGSMISLLCKPMVIVPLFSSFVGSFSVKTLDATFAEHMVPLNLSVGMVGVVFGVLSLVYSGMSIVWGYISDHKDMQSPLIVLGQFVFGTGFLLIGPSVLLPFIPFNITTVVVGMACIGVSLGCTLIPPMKCMVIGAIEMGLEESVETYALVSGLVFSTMTAGGIIGPICVGNLIEKFDYSIAFTVVGMCNFVAVFVSATYFSLRYLRRRRLYKNKDRIRLEDLSICCGRKEERRSLIEMEDFT